MGENKEGEVPKDQKGQVFDSKDDPYEKYLDENDAASRARAVASKRAEDKRAKKGKDVSGTNKPRNLISVSQRLILDRLIENQVKDAIDNFGENSPEHVKARISGQQKLNDYEVNKGMKPDKQAKQEKTKGKK